jgi:Zn-dependent alcohol dehydrogenase
VLGFIPACGRCPSCSTGHQNLCDLGALILAGWQPADGTSRHHIDGHDAALMAGQLKLDELVTKTYDLADVNTGYQDLRDGKNIRGLIVYD